MEKCDPRGAPRGRRKPMDESSTRSTKMDCATTHVQLHKEYQERADRRMRDVLIARGLPKDCLSPLLNHRKKVWDGGKSGMLLSLPTLTKLKRCIKTGIGKHRSVQAAALRTTLCVSEDMNVDLIKRVIEGLYSTENDRCRSTMITNASHYFQDCTVPETFSNTVQLLAELARGEVN